MPEPFFFRAHQQSASSRNLHLHLRSLSHPLVGADGDGIQISGNVPNSISDQNYFYDFSIGNVSGNGIQTSGGDANTNRFYNGVILETGLSGVYDHSFLGNSYYGIQVQGTARNTSSTGFIRRTNNLYYSLVDGNLGNDPPSSPNQWQLLTASVGADTWSAGTTYNVGAAYRTSGGSNQVEFIGCYTEGNGPPSLFQSASGGKFSTTVIGGLVGNSGSSNDKFNGFVVGKSYAYSYSAYSNNPGDYGFQTTGGSGSPIGFLANNVNATLAAEKGVFDVQINSIPTARYAGRFDTGSFHKTAVISSWNLAGTEKEMQLWDGEDLATWAPTDNTISFGKAAFRWSQNFSVNYRPGAGTATWTSQAGKPEASLTSTGGTFVTDTATGLGYLKTTVASGNTGYKKIILTGDVATQANSTAAVLADLVTDFNALLAKLKAGGVMAP